MEKIKLSNTTEFNLIPMGVDNKEKRRYFKFVSDLSYEEIKLIFSDSTNLQSIDYILTDGSTTQTFTDCVSLKALSVDFGVQVDELTTADIYTVEISTDAVEREIELLRAEVERLTALQGV